MRETIYNSIYLQGRLWKDVKYVQMFLSQSHLGPSADPGGKRNWKILCSLLPQCSDMWLEARRMEPGKLWLILSSTSPTLACTLRKQDRHMDALGVNRLESVFGCRTCEKMWKLVSDMPVLATLLYSLAAIWPWELTELQFHHLWKGANKNSFIFVFPWRVNEIFYHLTQSKLFQVNQINFIL